MNRPSGSSSYSILDAFNAAQQGQKRRSRISNLVRGESGLPTEAAVLPSVHLRWGLEQMKLRGWSNTDWGMLFDENGEPGEGPVCILESVGTPMDAPGSFTYESAEQHYLRRAFVELGWEPPLYLSEWNDAQTDFSTIETLMLTAIALAEDDEADDINPIEHLSNDERMALYGITDEQILACARQQTSERIT